MPNDTEFSPQTILNRLFRIKRPSLTVRTSFGDSAAIDAAGRLRVSNPTEIWDSQFEYNNHPLF